MKNENMYYYDISKNGNLKIFAKKVDRVNEFLNGFRIFNNDIKFISFMINIENNYNHHNFTEDTFNLNVFAYYEDGAAVRLSRDVITHQDLLDILNMDPFN